MDGNTKCLKLKVEKKKNDRPVTIGANNEKGDDRQIDDERWRSIDEQSKRDKSEKEKAKQSRTFGTSLKILLINK